MRRAIAGLAFAAVALAATVVSGSAGTLFEGPYAPENWSTSGDGTGTVAQPPGENDTLVMSYNLGTGFSGARDFWVTAPESETLAFDWSIVGCHSFWEPTASLLVFVDGPGGRSYRELWSMSWQGCDFTAGGSETVAVNAGFAFGFRVTGSHNDSAQLLIGDVTIVGGDPPPPTDDVTAPLLSIPADVTVEGNTTGGADGVVLPVVTATDDSGPVSVICSHSDGFFPLGTTEVTCSATDPSGNTGEVKYDVNVIDTAAPAFTIGGDITVLAFSSRGVSSDRPRLAKFLASGVASDVVDGDVETGHNAPARFGIGSTSVTFWARDDSLNTTWESRNVHVVTLKQFIGMIAQELREGDREGLANLFTQFISDCKEERQVALASLIQNMYDRLEARGKLDSLIRLLEWFAR